MVGNWRKFQSFFAAFVYRCLDWIFSDNLKSCIRFWVVELVESVIGLFVKWWSLFFIIPRSYKAGFVFLLLHPFSIWFFIGFHLILNSSRFMTGFFEWECLCARWCWVMVFVSLYPKSCMKAALHWKAQRLPKQHWLENCRNLGFFMSLAWKFFPDFA